MTASGPDISWGRGALAAFHSQTALRATLAVRSVRSAARPWRITDDAEIAAQSHL
ncbi:MAG TPA: hypothetical protein VG710_09325 [Opitutus sp.]|nr:hypothetical protein [Opitutus sp.]